MKRLLVLRHAKSSWKVPGQADHERALNKRGRLAAPLMGALLLEQGIVPDLILSSTAVRARATTQLLTEACDYQGEPVFEEQLYLAPPSTYIAHVARVDNELQTVMVVGHNPGLEALVGQLTGRIFAMPTAGLAELILPLDDWQSLSMDCQAVLRNFWKPRDLD